MTKSTILFLYQTYQYQNQNNVNQQDVQQSHHVHKEPPPPIWRPSIKYLPQEWGHLFLAIIPSSTWKRNKKMKKKTFMDDFTKMKGLSGMKMDERYKEDRKQEGRVVIYFFQTTDMKKISREA